MLIKSSLDNNKILLSTGNSFEHQDEFEPLRHLSLIFPDSQKENLLTKESFRTKIQDSSDLMIPIITTIITIVTTFFFKPP